MRPKKKDSTYKPVAEVHADHELFLQAFEKPTQIYRYLRTRNILSPIFLQRNFYYMKGRMSRTHKNRQSFSLNQLLSKVQEKAESRKTLPGTSLNLVFTGFTDSKLENASGELARIETQVVKISHKKRKESAGPLVQVSMGSRDVSINPGECDKVESSTASTLSIPTSHFSVNNGSQVKSYVLLFTVTLVHDQENVGEPLPKRRRLSRSVTQDPQQMENTCTNGHGSLNGDMNGFTTCNGSSTTCYTAELVVYDKMSRCQLTPGQYELIAQPNNTDLPLPSKGSPKKHATWDKLDGTKIEGPFMALDSSPVLMFNLSWTEDSSPALEKPKLKVKQCLDMALCNSFAAKPKPLGVASPEAPQLVLYQFIYNNNSRQQTESRRDFHCPWCSLNCCRLYSLLKHLKLCHARFSFTYVPHPKGARIDVSLNECFDGSYAGNPYDLGGKPTGCTFTRTGPTRRTSTTGVLVCRPKRPKPSLSEFLEQDENDFDVPRSYILGHNRMYHHTMICLPVQPHELDIDSEGEHDSEWVRIKTRMMIDEFTDVNEGEKELMKMWNLHVMKFNFVGDCQVPRALQIFLEIHGKELLQKKLYKNVILHIASLHDFGLVGSGMMYKCTMELHKLMAESSLKSEVSGYINNQIENSNRPFMMSPKRSHSPPKEIKSVDVEAATINVDQSNLENSDNSQKTKKMKKPLPVALKLEEVNEHV